MQNFDELKNMWQTSKNDLPTAKEIFSEIKTTRKKMIGKNILLILLLCATFAFIVWVGGHYDYKIITTEIGIIITLIAIVVGIIFNTQLTKLMLKQNDPTLDNYAYLQQLISFRTRQRQIQTKGISIYFILLTTGIVLYMYEFAVRDLKFGIISYTVTLAWIAFNWFFIRKRSIAKHEREINKQIAGLENIINNYSSTL